MIQQFHSWKYICKNMKTLIQKDTCTPVFIVALYTTVSTWKLAIQVPINREMDKEDVVYVYNGVSFSHKKN